MDFFQNSDEVEIFWLFVKNRWNWKSEWFNASFSRLSSQSQWREQSKVAANLEQTCTPYEVYLYRGECSACARGIESFQFSPMMKSVLIFIRRNVCDWNFGISLHDWIRHLQFIRFPHWSLCEFVFEILSLWVKHSNWVDAPSACKVRKSEHWRKLSQCATLKSIAIVWVKMNIH